MHYTKPPLSYADQVKRLKDRGLHFDAGNDGIKFFQHVSNYRFSGYCLPFQDPRDSFVEGASFEKIEALYRLDEQLRNDVLELLSPIEVYLRTLMTFELSAAWGAFAHYDPLLFRRDFDHATWIENLEKEVKRAKELFIEHYKTKYDDFPKLPIWMAAEIMSMGALSKLYSGLIPDAQRRICSIFEIHQVVLVNWFHVITYLRNICAHHSRLWDRKFAIRPIIPNKDKRWTGQNFDNQCLFTVIAMLEWICRKAALPLTGLNKVHSAMQSIAVIDKRFKSIMKIPEEREIGRCWEGLA